MAFPTSLSNVIDNVTNYIAAHINNLEAKVGIDNSTDTTSLDYKVANRVVSNVAIVAATKTKITYDAKGLVTAGTDANLDDLGDVVCTTPDVDDVLTFDGVNWVCRAGAIGAGNGIIEYLADTDSPDVTDAKYLVLSRTPTTTVETSVSANVILATSPVEIKSFIMTSTGIGATTIPAGLWEFTIYANNSGGTTTGFDIVVYVATVSGGVVTLGSPLFTTTNQTVTSVLTEYAFNTIQPAFTGLTTAHRLVFVFRATQSIAVSRTVTITIGGSTHASHIHTPLQTRHNDLAGLNVGDYIHLTAAQAVIVGNTSNTNTGDLVKATSAEVVTGTDNDKFVTAKAIKDANIIPSASYMTLTGSETGTNKTFTSPIISGAGGTTAGQQGFDTTDHAILIGDGTANLPMHIGHWKAFTPTWGNLTNAGAGAENTGLYCQIGKTVHFKAYTKLGATPTVGALNLGFPIAINTSSLGANAWVGLVTIYDASGAIYFGYHMRSTEILIMAHGATYIGFAALSSTVPMTWAVNDYITVTGTYEAT